MQEGGPQYKSVIVHQLGPLSVLTTSEIDCFVSSGSGGVAAATGLGDVPPLIAALQPETWMEIKSHR